MDCLLTLFIFAVLAVSAFAEPLRHRRQTSDTFNGTSIPLPCPVKCSWSLSKAWAKAISFDEPSPNMVDEQIIHNRTDVFGIMCGLYGEYRHCLDNCIAKDSENELYKSALAASPPFDQVCTNKQADFDNALPCLTNNSKSFRTACQTENENLLADSIRLHDTTEIDNTVTRAFCRSANIQLFCIFPIVRQTCGETPYNLIRSITNASLVSLRETVPDQTIKALYPECAKYFDTVANGLPAPPTTTSVSAVRTTPSINSTDSNATTFDSIKRDDAQGPTYPQGGRFGSTYRLGATTTPSNSPKWNLNNILALFIFSMLFVFPCH